MKTEDTQCLSGISSLFYSVSDSNTTTTTTTTTLSLLYTAHTHTPTLVLLLFVFFFKYTLHRRSVGGSRWERGLSELS